MENKAYALFRFDGGTSFTPSQDGSEPGVAAVQSCAFSHCEFVGVPFENVTFEDCTFDHCTFKDCTMEGVEFNDCEFTDTTGECCTLVNVRGNEATTWENLVWEPGCTLEGCDAIGAVRSQAAAEAPATVQTTAAAVETHSTAALVQQEMQQVVSQQADQALGL